MRQQHLVEFYCFNLLKPSGWPYMKNDAFLLEFCLIAGQVTSIPLPEFFYQPPPPLPSLHNIRVKRFYYIYIFISSMYTELPTISFWSPHLLSPLVVRSINIPVHFSPKTFCFIDFSKFLWTFAWEIFTDSIDLQILTKSGKKCRYLTVWPPVEIVLCSVYVH